RERRRRGVVIASLTAVAAACVAAVAIVMWPGGSAPARPAPQAFSAVRTSPVTATAQLVPKAWGTEIDLRCHYPNVPSYASYNLVVIDKDQHRYSGGSWTLVPGRTITFTGGTSVRRADIDRVQITLPDGTPILQLHV
ncbi:MAG: hypothetical protein QOC66_2319, partial [Pseudonocardiales bacterium]|nr:hypothetical protein [Pseudonocardiales bacterium]